MKNKTNWKPDSWRKLPIKQQPQYDNIGQLTSIEAELSQMPGLIAPSEARELKNQLAKVAQGKAFLLQGGDCAESFAEFSETNLRSYFRVMLQMTVALMYGAGKPVVKVGRVAGQFAKPRSDATEKQGDKELPSYRGDVINRMDFTPESRRADPENLRRVYFQSAATLNYLRSLASGGYASLKRVNRFNQRFIKNSPQGERFEDLIHQIENSIEFMRACGLSPARMRELSEATFYTSHEGLLLNYEQAFTRLDEDTDEFYNTATHMLWIGDRTRTLGEAHIEYFRGISNPIGMKVGPSLAGKEDELLKVIDALNPENEAGRLTLICRMGADKAPDLLPGIIRAVAKEGKQVVWSCDPMHGNTIKSPNGYKTRPFNKILGEVRTFFEVHQAEGTHAGGVHFEMTGQDVTECIGGAQAISEVNLKDRYHTHCDPRLNASQALELAFLVCEELKK
jgi:3-deoxy-7-phosphoheptulonate synthase